LEDGHEEAERLALAALALGEVEAVLQVGLQAFVEGPFAVVHDKALDMHKAAGEEWRAVGLAGIGLGSPEDYRIQPMASCSTISSGLLKALGIPEDRICKTIRSARENQSAQR
jgi:hypothetical protein